MKTTKTEIVMTKKELSEWVQCLTNEWRDELKAHGIETDSCYLTAAWRSLEKIGFIKMDWNKGDFELVPDEEEQTMMKDGIELK